MPHSFDHVRRATEAALEAADAHAAITALRPHARAHAAEEGARFRELLTRIPENAWQDDVELASAMGVSYRAAGSPRGSAALGYLEAAEAVVASSERDPAERIIVRLAHVDALRSLGRIDAAAEALASVRELEQTLVDLPVPLRVELGARTALATGMLALHRGEFLAARRELEFANGLAPTHLTRAEQVECLGGLAIVEYIECNLPSSERHANASRALAAGSSLAASGYAAPALAAATFVAVDRGDLARAAELEPEMLDAACRNDWEPFAYIVAGYHRLADRQLADGLDYLERATRGFRTWTGSFFGRSVAELLRATLLVHFDQDEEAWSILHRLPSFEQHVLCPPRIVALLRLGLGDLNGAADALRDCERLGDAHSVRTLMEVRMLRAAIEYQRGELTLSDAFFDRSLATVLRTGSIAPLRIVPPATLGGLAARALERHPEDAAGDLLRLIAARVDQAAPDIDPLSPRELLVLAEVEKGSTVGAIAAALYVSPNTVKTHLRRLYRKLGVSTRADAVRVATALGLGRRITLDSPVPQIADTSPS